MTDGTGHTVVIILQCIQVSNHYVVYLKLVNVVCQLYLKGKRASYETVIKDFENKSKIDKI